MEASDDSAETEGEQEAASQLQEMYSRGSSRPPANQKERNGRERKRESVKQGREGQID